MSEPFIGQVSMVGFNFAPRHWAFCNGQILPIDQNQVLFSLIGNTYGGDGVTTFALPNLQGRTPMHMGNPHYRGEMGGIETVPLRENEMPQHTHPVNASNDPANAPGPTENAFAVPANPIYGDPTSLVSMNSESVTNAGSGQGHYNMQPYLAVNFIIALER